MNTRELEELSRCWSEQELTAALLSFIDEIGRLPLAGELPWLLARRRGVTERRRTRATLLDADDRSSARLA
jgi:hypothetical protein